MAVMQQTCFVIIFFRSFNDKNYDLPDCMHFINDNLQHLTVTEDTVLNILNKLDTSKAYGVDGIPAYIYKGLSNELC